MVVEIPEGGKESPRECNRCQERKRKTERVRQRDYLRVSVSLREEQSVWTGQCVQPWFACVVCMCVQKERERVREREIERKTLCNSSRSEAEDSSLEPGVL